MSALCNLMFVGNYVELVFKEILTAMHDYTLVRCWSSRLFLVSDCPIFMCLRLPTLLLYIILHFCYFTCLSGLCKCYQVGDVIVPNISGCSPNKKLGYRQVISMPLFILYHFIDIAYMLALFKPIVFSLSMSYLRAAS